MPDNQNNQPKRSPLESLQEKIYQSGGEVGQRPEAPEVFAPRERIDKKEETKWLDEDGTEYISVKKYQKKKLISTILTAIGVVAVGVAIYLGYVYFFQTFKKSDVLLKISGPESVESGEIVEFSVSYQNRSNFDLENAVLVFDWPQGAIPKDSEKLKIEQKLGTIQSGRAKSFAFSGQFFGPKNGKVNVKAELAYIPKGKERSYSAKAESESIISATPFSIVMSVPLRAVSGNEMELLLEYQNLSQTSFPDMQLKLEYPEGFVFSGADPAPSASPNIWDFDVIGGRESGKIKIKGVLNGSDNENQIFKALIGKSDGDDLAIYADEDVSTVMSSTILFVYQTVNQSRGVAVSPGGILQYKITYRNTSDVAIPNVIISAKLDGELIDYRDLDISFGSFSGATNSIIWNSSGVRDLGLVGPGEEGEVRFSVRTKSQTDIKDFSDKNFVISSVAKADSDQIPATLKGIPLGNEDRLEVKLNTIVDFSVRGLYKNAPIENTGPIPPRVGQKTTYNIIWQLTNTANDIDNARIEAILPPSVNWEGKISPVAANIKYDNASGRVTWDIGKIPGGAGFIMPAMQIAFQISLTPGQVDAGRSVDLISEAKFSGTDSFTGTVLSGTESKKTTYLLEDPYIVEMRGERVAQ